MWNSLMVEGDLGGVPTNGPVGSWTTTTPTSTPSSTSSEKEDCGCGCGGTCGGHSSKKWQLWLLGAGIIGLGAVAYFLFFRPKNQG